LVRHGSIKTKIGSEYNPKRAVVCGFAALLLTEMPRVDVKKRQRQVVCGVFKPLQKKSIDS
jgi:hypothetical protein